MRETYDYLTDATKATFEGNVKAVCNGWDKSDKYIYQILSEEKPDFFAAFLSMYIGTLKGNVSTHHWDNELGFARFRYQKPVQPKDATQCFKEKFSAQNLTMTKFIEFFADGDFTLEEIKEIESCLDTEEQNIQMIRTMLNFRKSILVKD